MDFNTYQEAALTTAIFPEKDALPYLALGLASEAGEVAGKAKKVIRDNGGVLSEEKARAIADEAGDVLWYLSVLASHLGVSLDYLANRNIDKLVDRRERGVLGGSGDNR